MASNRNTFEGADACDVLFFESVKTLIDQTRNGLIQAMEQLDHVSAMLFRQIVGFASELPDRGDENCRIYVDRAFLFLHRILVVLKPIK